MTDPATKNIQAGRRAVRTNAPLLALVALLAGSLLTRCASSDPKTGSPGTDGGAASGPCTPATVPADCPLPPSICVDATTLGYYTEASCVAGRCQWTRSTTLCFGACMNGACIGSGTTTTGGPPPPPPGTGTGGAGETDAGGTGGAGPSGDGGDAPDAGPCTPSTVATDCSLPPSICDDGSTLGYYTNASCVDGRCQWTRQTVRCTGACVNGACLGSGTTTTGGPPAPGTGGSGAQ